MVWGTDGTAWTTGEYQAVPPPWAEGCPPPGSSTVADAWQIIRSSIIIKQLFKERTPFKYTSKKRVEG
jgi:hypothetical protein